MDKSAYKHSELRLATYKYHKHKKVSNMKQYKVFGVRLPLDASTQIEDVSERTGIQKSVLLWSVILNGIKKEHNETPAVGAVPGSSAPTAGAQHTSQEMAVHAVEH